MLVYFQIKKVEKGRQKLEKSKRIRKVEKNHKKSITKTSSFSDCGKFLGEGLGPKWLFQNQTWGKLDISKKLVSGYLDTSTFLNIRILE